MTRAIRNAMAVSATVLALSLPGAVLAGGLCSHETDGRNYLCNADFVRADAAAGAVSPVDLTVVADDAVPSSVYAADTASGGFDWASHTAPVFSARELAVANQIDDLSWVDGHGFDGNGSDTNAAHMFSFGSDIGADATDIAAFIVASNDTDIIVSGVNPAIGLDVVDDATTVSNSALISASADGGTYSAYATGVRARASYYDADVSNTGTISADATSTGFMSYATGVFNHSPYGNASLINEGTISADAAGAMWAFAFGVYNIASIYHDVSTLDNSGLISANAHVAGGADTQFAWAAGARVSSGYGGYSTAGYDDVRLTNAGSIEATATVDGGYGSSALAWGAFSQSINAYGAATIENEGSISAYARSTSASGYATFADALGAYATSKNGVSSIVNNGDITAATQVDGFGYARSIAAKAGYLSSSNSYHAYIQNNDTIRATAYAQSGYASAIGASTGELDGSDYVMVQNAYGASITADAQVAVGGTAIVGGISARSNHGAYVVNQGDIVATAQVSNELGGYDTSYSVAVGILATSTQGGDARVYNEGNITATATADGTYTNTVAEASGIHARGYYTAAVHNAGVVTASASSVGSAYAYGAIANSQHVSYLTNTADGSLSAMAAAQDGNAVAIGAYLSGRDSTTLTNYGDISADASIVSGTAQAYAALVYGTYAGVGLLINGGNLSASATAGDGGYAYATGAYVAANVASVFNDDSSTAIAVAGAGGTAVAKAARAYGMYSAVSNYGDLRAQATADGGSVTARGSESFGYYGSTAYNAGTIEAIATTTAGDASATGSYSLGVLFDSTTTNAGSISAYAGGDGTEAIGALNVAAYIGDAVTVNDGTISAVAVGGIAEYGETEAVAFGVYNFAQYYDSVVDNRGSVIASAAATTYISPSEGFLQAKAIGAMAFNGYGIGDTVVTNSGEIGASAAASTGYAVAWGAVAQSPGVYGGIALVDNDGSIWSYAHADIGIATATGAYTVNALGTSEIVNHGDIVATARSERGITGVAVNFAVGYGARARSYYENATIGNYGRIESNVSVVGGIAYSYGVVAVGGNATVHNAAGASITATVEAELFGGAFVNGVTAGGLYGVDVVNDGSITAYASASGYTDGALGFYGGSGATGIVASGSVMGDANVVNNGIVNAIAVAQDAPSMLEGGASAVGIDGYGNAVIIANAGTINAISQVEFGVAGTSGINAHGKYSNDITNAAGASIFSYASAGRLSGDAGPATAIAWGTQSWGADYATTTNAGSIAARAVTAPDDAAARGDFAAAYGATVGRYSGVMASALVNHGDIEATAQGDFGYATAYGTYVHGLNEATISNTGSVRAAAVSAEGNAFAVGSHAYSLNASVTYNCDDYGCDWANPIVTIEDGRALIDNAGNIVATASAAGGVGYSYGVAAISALQSGITNAGSISARTDADDARATGAIVNGSYGHSTLSNSDLIGAIANGSIANAIGVTVAGDAGNADNGYLAASIDNQGRIVAVATGDDATATGASLTGRYTDGVGITNAGTITAAAYGSAGYATAVSMESGGHNLLTNTGSISALGDGERIAIASSANATAQLFNQGTVVGAVRTGNLDDSFENAEGATWFALGESGFGGGNDDVVNRGLLVMDNAAIRLGGSGTPYAGIGTFAHHGADAFENFGTIAVLGSDNVIEASTALPVHNNGTITFVDGDTDDVLTVLGDFAGQGAINIDVSGLNQASDKIYVEGHVAASTAQTIDVNMLDLPDAPDFKLAIMTAADPIEGDYELGNVHFVPNGFLSMDFNLTKAQNALLLGMEVTGLSSAGSVASVIAPGVQSLMNAQVGSWRQRMGIVPQAGEPGFAPWLRFFSESGDVAPDHSANFGSGGVFGFHQSNHGVELGLNARPFEHVSVGLLLAESEGSQNISGAGSDRFDGKTVGAYATWAPAGGFYLDVSYRVTDVDARLRSTGGTYETEATARATNIEAGYTAWKTASGFNFVPQVQYTHTRIGDIGTLNDGSSEFASNGGTSSRARLGLAIDRTFQGGNFTWTPYGSLSALHEFDGQYEHSINDSLAGRTNTEGTSAMVELGLGARRGKLSFSGGLNWTDGGALESVTGGQLTMRYSW